MKNPIAHLARTLRWNATSMEKRLWFWLRKRPCGCKFRRQVVLGPYIVDFACYAARLVIEVDGEFHADQASDSDREAWLVADGWEVARYWNRDVRHRLDDVLADVEGRLAARGGEHSLAGSPPPP
jgi:very-short-patch-repair endonuclease